MVNRDGRLIEIQVRTENQHTWAESVESVGRAVGAELKWGVGLTEILEYYVVFGEVVDLADRGVAIPSGTLQRVNAAKQVAIQSILRQRRGDDSNG